MTEEHFDTSLYSPLHCGCFDSTASSSAGGSYPSVVNAYSGHSSVARK